MLEEDDEMKLLNTNPISQQKRDGNKINEFELQNIYTYNVNGFQYGTFIPNKQFYTFFPEPNFQKC